MINTYLTRVIVEMNTAAENEKKRLVQRISASPENFLSHATAKNVAIFVKAELMQAISDAIQTCETDKSVIHKAQGVCNDAMRNAVGQIGYSNGAGMTAPFAIEVIHSISSEFIYFAQRVEEANQTAK